MFRNSPICDYVVFNTNDNKITIQYNFIETLSTGYFYIQSFIIIVQELNMSSLYKLIKAFTANKAI